MIDIEKIKEWFSDISSRIKASSVPLPKIDPLLIAGGVVIFKGTSFLMVKLSEKIQTRNLLETKHKDYIKDQMFADFIEEITQSQRLLLFKFHSEKGYFEKYTNWRTIIEKRKNLVLAQADIDLLGLTLDFEDVTIVTRDLGIWDKQHGSDALNHYDELKLHFRSRENDKFQVDLKREQEFLRNKRGIRDTTIKTSFTYPTILKIQEAIDLIQTYFDERSNFWTSQPIDTLPIEDNIPKAPFYLIDTNIFIESGEPKILEKKTKLFHMLVEDKQSTDQLIETLKNKGWTIPLVQIYPIQYLIPNSILGELLYAVYPHFLNTYGRDFHQMRKDWKDVYSISDNHEKLMETGYKMFRYYFHIFYKTFQTPVEVYQKIITAQDRLKQLEGKRYNKTIENQQMELEQTIAKTKDRYNKVHTYSFKDFLEIAKKTTYQTSEGRKPLLSYDMVKEEAYINQLISILCNRKILTKFAKSNSNEIFYRYSWITDLFPAKPYYF